MRETREIIRLKFSACVPTREIGRRLGTTRRQLLEEIDRPALKRLPIEPYEFCEWRGKHLSFLVEYIEELYVAYAINRCANVSTSWE